jgi:hypothetical protein
VYDRKKGHCLHYSADISFQSRQATDVCVLCGRNDFFHQCTSFNGVYFSHMAMHCYVSIISITCSSSSIGHSVTKPFQLSYSLLLMLILYFLPFIVCFYFSDTYIFIFIYFTLSFLFTHINIICSVTNEIY